MREMLSVGIRKKYIGVISLFGCHKYQVHFYNHWLSILQAGISTTKLRLNLKLSKENLKLILYSHKMRKVALAFSILGWVLAFIYTTITILKISENALSYE